MHKASDPIMDYSLSCAQERLTPVSSITFWDSVGQTAAMESWRARTKLVMQAKRVSQDTLAERLDVTQGAVQKWLAGTRHPKLEDIDRIAAALGVPGYELTHGVTPADTVTDLPELARSVLQRLIAAQRSGAATPELWTTLDGVVQLSLQRAQFETHDFAGSPADNPTQPRARA